MGAPFPQVQSPQTDQIQGKGSVQHQADYAAKPMGKGGQITYPGQDAQPRVGQPNNYSNTIGPWDNANIQPSRQSGKGKGA